MATEDFNGFYHIDKPLEQIARLTQAIKKMQEDKLSIGGGFVRVKKQEVNNKERIMFLHVLEEFLIHSLVPLSAHSDKQQSEKIKNYRYAIQKHMLVIAENVLCLTPKEWRNKPWLGEGRDNTEFLFSAFDYLIISAKQNFKEDLSIFTLVFNSEFLSNIMNVLFASVPLGSAGNDNNPLDLSNYPLIGPDLSVDLKIITKSKSVWSSDLVNHVSFVLKGTSPEAFLSKYTSG